MSAHPPPVPPEQQPQHGKGDRPVPTGEQQTPPIGNLAEQAQAGNLKQNTTNKSFQQDR